MGKKSKVVVGLSGGKDSTAAILHLKEEGYDVHALTMKLGLKHEEERLGKIETLTALLDVPLTVCDIKIPFEELVINSFTRDYSISLTPNPCAWCNRKIKFELLMNYALQEMGADFFATGHYAEKIKYHQRWMLTEPKDRFKSQIYFLALIQTQALERVLFPLAQLTVAEVKQRVQGLPLANIEESQDVCFLQE